MDATKTVDTTKVYGLKCPLTRTIRYVGKSDDPWKRFGEHLAIVTGNPNAYPRLVAWLKTLRNAGVLPELVVLQEVPKPCWRIAERWWIDHLEEEGHALLNEKRFGGKHSEEKGRHLEEYEDTTTAADRIGISSSQLRRLCGQGRVPGAAKVVDRWLIPKTSWPKGLYHMGRPPKWDG